MPYIDQEEYKKVEERRIREGRARKAIRGECRYGAQPCGTCKLLENCEEDDSKFLAAKGF